MTIDKNNLKQTIKRAYDQYKPQDFVVGTDNLNPKREMVLDQMKDIERKVQQLANEIVRKRIKTPEKPKEKVRATLSGESPSRSNISRRELTERAGSVDDSLLLDIPKELEVLIGAFPGKISDLAKPPVIDCEAILQKYDFSKEFEVYEADDLEDDGGTTYRFAVTNTTTSSDDDSDRFEGMTDDNDCAQIELTWLKIIIAILKVISMLIVMVNTIISTIITAIQILCLAVGAWLNPPNLAQIAQIIIGLAMSLLMQIIAKLIQMLFDLLNLDCMADQVVDLLDQIQKCMDAFKSTLGLIDPKTISFVGDLAANGIEDMKKQLRGMMKMKGDAWIAAKNDLVKVFDPENLKKISKQFEQEAINTAMKNRTERTRASGKLSSLASDAKDVYTNIRKKKQEIMVEAQDAYENAIKGNKTKSSNTAISAILADANIQNVMME